VNLFVSFSCYAFLTSQYCNFANVSTRAAQERRYANRRGYLFEKEYLKKQKEKDSDTLEATPLTGKEKDKEKDKHDREEKQAALKYKPGEKKGDALRSMRGVFFFFFFFLYILYSTVFYIYVICFCRIGLC
jgi:hypothetical protein